MRTTKSMRAAELKKRLSKDHIFNNTCIFTHMQGAEEPYDQRTVNMIKLKLELWLDSWIKPELEDLLKS